VADHDGVVQIELLEEGGQVGRQPPDAVALGPGLGLAVTSQVDGDQPEPVRELVELGGPHVAAEGDPVEQHQRAPLAPLHGVDCPAVGCGQAVVGHVGRQREQSVVEPRPRPARIRLIEATGVSRVGGPVGAHGGGAAADHAGAEHGELLRLHGLASW
jgi:hypothetical protein